MMNSGKPSSGPPTTGDETARETPSQQQQAAPQLREASRDRPDGTVAGGQDDARLARIAELLGVSQDSFAQDEDEGASAEYEALSALLQAFLSIEDPDKRRHILEAAREAAGRTTLS